MTTVRFSAFLIFSLCYAISGIAQQVHTYVDSDSLQVGDPFTFTIVFDGNYSNIQFPGEEDFEEELSVRSIQRYQSPAGRDSIVYNLQFFAIENLTIGNKEIVIQMEQNDTVLTTAPVPLFFKTSLAAEDDEFRPMKPIFDFARVWWPWMIGLIILLALAYYLYQRYFNTRLQEEDVTEKAPSPPPRFTSPLDELKKSISKLDKVDTLESDEQFERFYIELGDSIRYYLKRVYEFPALEMTTSEISLNLQEKQAQPKLVSITRKVLNEADIVKFANFNPGKEGARSALESAERFIETAEVVNFEQIKYMKYKYREKHRARENEVKQKAEQPS